MQRKYSFLHPRKKHCAYHDCFNTFRVSRGRKYCSDNCAQKAIKDTHKAWRDNNKDKWKAFTLRWRENNRAHWNAYQKKRIDKRGRKAYNDYMREYQQKKKNYAERSKSNPTPD